MADYSGSIATDATAQTAAAADVNRATLVLNNPSDTDMYYAFGTTAVQDSPSFPLLQGQTVMYGPEYRSLITQSISIIGPTAAKKFTIFDTKM